MIVSLQVWEMYGGRSTARYSPEDPGGGRVNAAADMLDVEGPHSSPASPVHKVKLILLLLVLYIR